MSLCPFKNSKNKFINFFEKKAGKPKQSFHSFRILDHSIVDYIGTFIMAFALTYFFKLPFDLNIVILFSLGIVFHVLYGIDTNATRYLGLVC